jgi:3-(3-hydroxy-phenyl)propionate hydroxylase
VIPRIKALLGHEVEFELEWVSLYTFACRRMEKFRHGRVLFAGDAAHTVSPFGARGANSGVQDADNLAWKLRLVSMGKAPDALLDSYGNEREQAADENILNSTRSTDFITPKSPVSRMFRDAVLTLSRHHAFARKLVNSGRLSLPATYRGSALNTEDADQFMGAMTPGAPCCDAPVTLDGKPGWFLQQVGNEFCGIYFSDGDAPAADVLEPLRALGPEPCALKAIVVLPQGASGERIAGITMVEDAQGLLARRLDARAGAFYLLRPDQHVCARWRRFDSEQVRAAIARATCNDGGAA